MKTRIAQAFCIFALAITCLVGVGCNTMEGAGKDIEKGGEKIQDAAD